MVVSPTTPPTSLGVGLNVCAKSGRVTEFLCVSVFTCCIYACLYVLCKYLYIVCICTGGVWVYRRVVCAFLCIVSAFFVYCLCFPVYCLFFCVLSISFCVLSVFFSVLSALIYVCLCRSVRISACLTVRNCLCKACTYVPKADLTVTQVTGVCFSAP